MKSIGMEEKKILLQLAKKTIEKKSKKIWLTDKEIKELPEELKKKLGGFVTLTKNGQLRGCIGYILPLFPLYQTVIENAYNAAYQDPRFPPVSEKELKDIEIEISILTVPEKIDYRDSLDLLDKLQPHQDGVIIKKGYYSSTFLPQVWEQLPDKVEFLEHLCMKAGLNADEWKEGKLEVEIYHAVVIEEKDIV